MKIAITPKQPVSRIVKELERLGFKAWCVDFIDSGFVVTNKMGIMTTFYKDIFDTEPLVTLKELKGM